MELFFNSCRLILCKAHNVNNRRNLYEELEIKYSDDDGNNNGGDW